MQLPEHTPNERHFLSKRQRYQQVPLPDEFSDEELARDWTLSSADLKFLASFNRRYRVLNAIHCQSIRLYGRFLNEVDRLACPSSNKWNRSTFRLSECFAHHFQVTRHAVGSANYVSRWSSS